MLLILRVVTAIAVCVALVGAATPIARAARLDENGLPIRDGANLQKDVCVTYTIAGVTTELPVVYPSAMTYHVIGSSGASWLYFYDRGALVRLRVDSLTLGPLYETAGSDVPNSCTP